MKRLLALAALAALPLMGAVEVYGIRYDILYILDPYADHVILELFCEVEDERGT